MMLFSRLPILSAVVAAFLQTSHCVPLDARAQTKAAALAQAAAMNLTFTYGTYNASDPLSKRDMPVECAFASGRWEEYAYQQVTGLPAGETACVGWETGAGFSICGDGLWQDPDWSDIQACLAEQVTLDGAFKGSNHGSWASGFDVLRTSAFSNRDWTPFVLGMVIADVKSILWYWSRDGDFAFVQREPQHCP
jgi:hypothetical protein